MSSLAQDRQSRRRERGHILKILRADHPTGRQLTAAMASADRNGLERYISALRRSGTALPPDLSILPSGNGSLLGVQHRWVKGMPLPSACATGQTSAFISAVATIGSWVKALEGTDARLDTNLANFILVDGKPVTVDVLPPLIPSHRPPPQNLFDVLSGALCFDTSLTLNALVGYAARCLLQHAPPGAGAEFAAVAGTIYSGRDCAGAAEFPYSWFRARAVLGLRALSEQVPHTTALDFFASTSVLGFSRYGEKERAEQICRVKSRIEELDL